MSASKVCRSESLAAKPQSTSPPLGAALHTMCSRHATCEWAHCFNRNSNNVLLLSFEDWEGLMRAWRYQEIIGLPCNFWLPIPSWFRSLELFCNILLITLQTLSHNTKIIHTRPRFREMKTMLIMSPWLIKSKYIFIQRKGHLLPQTFHLQHK